MIEKDPLYQFFINEFPFNKEGLGEFINSFFVKSYKKGDVILKSGQIVDDLRFIDSGIVREYYATSHKEKNIDFYTKSGFITDFSSFINTIPTKKYQECLDDVQLRVLPKEAFIAFIKKYHCGKLFIETIFQRIVLKKETTEFNHFVNTAEELYHDIMNTKSDWLVHIPQYHIASYLGITPETLSRIRKRI